MNERIKPTSSFIFEPTKVKFVQMKTKLIYSLIPLLMVLLSETNHAQQVLSSTGGFWQNSSGTIAYTLGEVVIGTQANGNQTITQGLHQTEIVVTYIDYLPVNGLQVLAYPNPASDYVTLRFDKSVMQNIEFIMIDMNGKLLLREKPESAEVTVSLVAINPGVYFIRIFMNSRKIQTIKIVKIHK
jgi:hypothetical protein